MVKHVDVGLNTMPLIIVEVQKLWRLKEDHMTKMGFRVQKTNLIGLSALHKLIKFVNQNKILQLLKKDIFNL